ncbi:tryptophan--tRNA ligase [Candidatus Nomurabacteria bacterium]|nr:tryptophan--tRNA ligase [Candidatus Nomurabacteria bacterium]
MAKKPILFSGLQPTGDLHIGNYLGAVKNWVQLQNSGKYQMFIFIADLHALTGNQSGDDLRKNIMGVATELLAAGIDPKKTTLFVQSHVSGHADLAWVFNCVTPMSELERMTQYKDKSARQAKNVNVGLFDYPVLQVADILLYHGEVVPVGEDQVQHVELTRDCVRWFNKKYGEYFSAPKPLLTEIPRVMSLVEPTSKMSKSHGEKAYIALADEPLVIEKKVMKAVTASEGGAKSPGAQNLLELFRHFGNVKQYQEYVKAEKDGSIRYGDLKKDLSKAIAEEFKDFRLKRKEYLGSHGVVADILIDGAHRAQKVADKTMKEVRRRVGLR